MPFELREQDLNLRPSGYEPDELPDCSTPRYNIKGCHDIRSSLLIGGKWMEEDSNLRSRRQQIYSLPPLAARESIHTI